MTTTHTAPRRHGTALDAGRRRRRTVVVTDAVVGVVLATIPTVALDSPPDAGSEQVALGSTWS